MKIYKRLITPLYEPNNDNYSIVIDRHGEYVPDFYKINELNKQQIWFPECQEEELIKECKKICDERNANFSFIEKYVEIGNIDDKMYEF